MLEFSVGELVDQLAIIHLKIWHLEEDIAAAKDSLSTVSNEDIEKMCDQVITLNTKRNKIVASINEKLER